MEKSRTGKIYEEIGGYPLPPLPPVADIDNPESFVRLGIRPGSYRHFITNTALKACGFKSFYKTLPESLEPILRFKNMRLPGLYAPVISATLVLLDDPFKANPVERAASLLFAAYDLYSDIISGRMEPDQYGKSVFEMGLYPNLFNTSLVIDNKRARLHKNIFNLKINILVRGQYYILDLFNGDELLPYREVVAALQKIVNDSAKYEENTPYPSIGFITAANNQTQFKAFKALRKDEISRKSISRLSQSFLTLCLDIDTYPDSLKETASYTHNGNHGNRWYHSATQFVVFGNGRSSIIFNFTAYLDGITMARAGYEIYKRALRFPALKKSDHFVSPGNDSPPYQKLEWKFPHKYFKRIMSDIRLITDNQQAVFEMSNFGSTSFEKYGYKSVPIFVTALYMALKTFKPKAKSIRQFVSMAKYRCMSLVETEVVTEEVLKFAETANDQTLDHHEKIALLKKAVESQREAVRATRKELSLDSIFILYIQSLKKLKQIATIMVTVFFSLLSGRLRLFDRVQREVLISHPTSNEQIPIIGRPGVRVHYVKYFALHYQIMKHKIVITMLPSLNWPIPNAEFIRVLEEKLNSLHQLIQKDTTIEKPKEKVVVIRFRKKSPKKKRNLPAMA